TSMQKIQGVKFSQVNVNDMFWKPKMDKVATTTLKACIYQTEVKTPRIRNFQKVARNDGEKHEGIYYDDSDVYKALEAMAYSLKTHPDSSLEKKADEWIDIIAAAQQPDGYLNTYFTLTGLDKKWTLIPYHEDYNAGHLIEAAVAYYDATGKRKFLDVAIRVANNIDSTFRLSNRYWISGHEEIELALVKLYKATNNDRYLELADWYLSQRGKGYTNNTSWGTPEYWQDRLPVKQQTKITGHAVRAMYLYTGTADVAAQTGDAGYMNAMESVWQDVVQRNMYVTGGIGSSGDNEGFSRDYDLPNDDAYCETCASVGMVFWNQRMNWLTGESAYIDVLERSLYNAALDGLSLTGDHFFYDNVLASNGKNTRSEWFGTACCPANISRLVASLGNYIYGKSDDGVWVNLFVGSTATFSVGATPVSLAMETNYPWDGKIKLTVNPSAGKSFAMHVRLPGWLTSEPALGGLYTFTDTRKLSVPMTLNGKPVEYKIEHGYAVIEREWKQGDALEWSFPMETRRIVARDSVAADRGKVALQRGPLVYCVEGADNSTGVWNIVLPDDAQMKETAYQVLDEKVVALTTDAISIAPSADGKSVTTEKRSVTAIPYYVWANRGGNDMQVWIPTKVSSVKIQ
ncbi:MAG TPA: beta-L-arabinofuranosidase domain-containing protein, partial [Bacteroidota bacterium]|nr:beta-L-arabinofuranosidase domain-containing protein [Bacteroidota bacterium]